MQANNCITTKCKKFMLDSKWIFIKYLLLINGILEKVVHREDVNIIYSLVNYEIVSFL